MTSLAGYRCFKHTSAKIAYERYPHPEQYSIWALTGKAGLAFNNSTALGI